MKRSMKEIMDDEDGGVIVQVRASRILGPRQSLSKKRLRKACDAAESDPSSTVIDLVTPPRAVGRRDGAPPALESFSYRGGEGHRAEQSSSVRVVSEKSISDDFFEEAAHAIEEPATDESRRRRGRKFQLADSSDDEDYEPKVEDHQDFHSKVGSSSTGKRRIPVYRDTSAADDQAIAELLQEDELAEAEEVQDEEEEPETNDELDLIYNTLRKCDRIAANLRQELHSSNPKAVFDDRYAEVDVSAAKLVSQSDVCAACGITAANGQILKAYQLVGVNFMLLLNRKNVGGAILADEMGLGKTVQAVAFLALLKHLDQDPGPHLIVAPASLLDNWQRELNKWCPSFNVVLFHGNERASMIRELQAKKRAGKQLPFNVMLTCYTLFERRSAQQKEDRVFLRSWKWSCVLMDEAHFLKDKGSLRTRRLRELAQKAKCRVMLTGTPLQNDLQELWALLEFLLPDIFNTGKVDLSKLLGNRSSTATTLQEDGELINHMKAILGPFVLRRLKSDVMQQLVAKIQKVECINMEPEQALAYKETVKEYQDMTSALRAARSSNSTSVDALPFPKRQMQNIFTQLRKVANHPLLIRRIYSDRDVDILARKLHAREVFGNQCTEERVKDELKTYNDFSLHQLCIQNGLTGPGFGGKLTIEHPLGSAKCQVLARLLPQLKEGGHRPLIFSQWTQMLDILEWAFEAMDLTFVRLDGSTQVRDRQEIVDSFNNDSSIFAFLLSTRAGGQGLNLTGADTVIIHDVDFNPQMDRQAEDRCHRIGQMKPVTVYRLVTKGSVDESIYNIAQRKLVLDAAVLESGGDNNVENNDGDARTMVEILSEILAAAS